MKRRLAQVLIVAGMLGSMGIATANAAEAATCTTTSKKVTVEDGYTSDTKRVCQLANGGASTTTTHRVKDGDTTTTTTTSSSRTVTKKGKATVKRYVKVCTKVGGTETCKRTDS